MRLHEASERLGFELVNLSDLTDHPSPNYLLTLQTAQQKAIDADAGLLICTAGKQVLRFVPPLVITKDEIDQAIDILKKVLG